jgi:hypothetical protein
MLRGRMPNTSIVTGLSWGGLARTRRQKRSSSSARYRAGRMHVIFSRRRSRLRARAGHGHAVACLCLARAGAAATARAADLAGGVCPGPPPRWRPAPWRGLVARRSTGPPSNGSSPTACTPAWPASPGYGDDHVHLAEGPQPRRPSWTSPTNTASRRRGCDRWNSPRSSKPAMSSSTTAPSTRRKPARECRRFADGARATRRLLHVRLPAAPKVHEREVPPGLSGQGSPGRQSSMPGRTPPYATSATLCSLSAARSACSATSLSTAGTSSWHSITSPTLGAISPHW